MHERVEIVFDQSVGGEVSRGNSHALGIQIDGVLELHHVPCHFLRAIRRKGREVNPLNLEKELIPKERDQIAMCVDEITVDGALAAEQSVHTFRLAQQHLCRDVRTKK
jgi:glutamate synthase domain-containing protein 1